MTGLRTRDATNDDLPAILRIRVRSFGPLGIGGTDWWERVTRKTLDGRMLVVIDASGTVVGAGRIHPYEQAWGGRHLRMGGVAGVYVEPSARGRGVATTMSRALLTRMAELGDVVSCLFPTTPTLYRRCGYEFGGVQTRTTYPAHLVRDLASATGGRRVRAATPDDADLLEELTRTAHVRQVQSGPMVSRSETFREILERDELITYVTGDGSGLDGFVAYDLSDGAVTVEQLVASTAEAAAALWGVVGSGSSAAPTIRSYLDPRDPMLLSLAGLPATEVLKVPWMARVVDLAPAVGGRGFSPYAAASVELDVEDPDLPTNTAAGGSTSPLDRARRPASTTPRDAVTAHPARTRQRPRQLLRQ